MRVEGETNQRVGREGHESRYSSVSTSLPDRKHRTRYDEEEVKFYEGDRERRPRRKEDGTVYEEEDRHRHHHDRHPEAEVSGER